MFLRAKVDEVSRVEKEITGEESFKNDLTCFLRHTVAMKSSF